jgi:hypothetical protein
MRQHHQRPAPGHVVGDPSAVQIQVFGHLILRG